jgi:TusA-related sulfurtransferase
MTVTPNECRNGSSRGAEQQPGRVHTFDAGDLSCATGLAEEFRRQIQQIPLGDELLVTTGDPSAKEDLPPLARMMGHTVRSIENARDGSLVIDVERGR